MNSLVQGVAYNVLAKPISEKEVGFFYQQMLPISEPFLFQVVKV